MIKVRLLNDGGFNGLVAVTFPVEVMAYDMDVGVEVPVSELERIGADMKEFRHFRAYTWLPWEYALPMDDVEQITETSVCTGDSTCTDQGCPHHYAGSESEQDSGNGTGEEE